MVMVIFVTTCSFPTFFSSNRTIIFSFEITYIDELYANPTPWPYDIYLHSFSIYLILLETYIFYPASP